MTARPSSLEIGVSQDSELSLRRQLAARNIYKQGKRIHFGGASLAVVLALVAPLVLIYQPDLGPLLGAVAGLWVFASRLVFEPWRLRLQDKGARVQEMFDCTVLGIEWNDALTRRVSEEEVRQASKGYAKASGIRAWYPTPDGCTWPGSVLICQRSNVVWARRQHRAYALVLIIASCVWVAIGIAVCLIRQATLAEYLTTLALPSLPAVLDAGEMARRHLHAADNREVLEARVDDLLKDPDHNDESDLREVQDQLFGLRSEAPLIPEWFYGLIKDGYESDMQYAATHAAGDTPDGN